MGFVKYTTSIILFGLFSATLLSTKTFLSPFAASYYGYQIAVAILTIWSGILLWRQSKEKIGFALPLLVFVLYVIYTLLNSDNIASGRLNNGQLFLLINLFAFCSFSFLFQLQKIDLQVIAKIFIFLVLAEALLCIAQCFDWVATRGKLFEVYGSLPNPNYTAMFLSMTVPALLYAFFTEKAFGKYTATLSLFLLSIALLLLQCRTAVIGAFCGAIYFLALQFAWYEKIVAFSKSIKRIQLFLFGLLFTAFLSGTAYFLYHFKQASSEGRLMVWKISLDLAAQKPIFGQGTFTFEKTYNLAQANYFQSGKATADEVFSAAHIRVPYNDYLLSFIEGGSIGFLLFVAFIGSLLWLFRNKTKDDLIVRTAYTGVLAFSIMSLFNSQYYVTSVVAVLIFYAGLLCSISEVKNLKINAKIVAITLIVLGLYFLKSQYEMARAARNVKIASTFSRKEQPEKAIFILEKVSETLVLSDQMWWNHAAALYNKKDYANSLEKYQKTAQFTSDPDLFMDMGDCYMQLGNYPEAIKKCSLAMNIVPNRMKPKFMLMNIFAVQKDSTNTLKLASEILLMKPKGISKDAALYKEEASKMEILFKSNKE
jgi:O-antigen polymerase